MDLAAIDAAHRRKTEALASIPEGPSGPGIAEADLAGALRRLEAARAAYGSDHPDVRRAQREYELALSHRNDELGRWREGRIADQLARLDAEVLAHEADVRDLRKEVAEYQRRVETAPRWGQELANLTRDYDTLKAKYGATVSRKADAAAAEALLAADAPGLFRTIQPAVAPARPVAPDRWRLFLLGAVAAIAAGLASAALAEWLDTSLRGPEDAGALGVPVLAAIPRIAPQRNKAS
jgi:uncharacterized protein involved in exopolysaccharide biosynthesis